MNRREEQAFNDGKIGYSRGLLRGQHGRKNSEQIAAWKAGWDDAQRLAVAARATPEQAEESRRILAALKEFTKTL